MRPGLQAVGLASVIGGLVTIVVARLAGIPTGWAGIVLPIGAGILAIFLGGLVIGWAQPPERRLPIFRHRRIVLAIALWSAISFAILATAPGSMRLAFAPLLWLPRPVSETAVAAAAGVTYVGAVFVSSIGTLYVLGFLGLAMARRVQRLVRPTGSS